MRSLHHLGYVVANMAGARRRFEVEGYQVTLGPTDDAVQRVTCALMTHPAELPVELVAPLPGAPSPVDNRLQRGGGLDHVCYGVDDLDAELAAEEAHGALVVCTPVLAVTFDRHVAFVQRRSGLVVELLQLDPYRP